MARKSEVDGAALVLPRSIYNEFLKQRPRFKPFGEDYRYRGEESEVTIPTRLFKKVDLEFLHGILAPHKGKYKYITGQVNGHLRVLEDPKGAELTKLEMLESAIIEYVKKDIIEGWVFDEDGAAMLVTDVTYYPFRPGDGRRDSTPAHVVMTMEYWDNGNQTSTRKTWHANEVTGKTVVGVLTLAGYLKESKELVAAYEEDEATYLKWRESMGVQFLGSGKQAFETGNWRQHDSDLAGTRLVVDDRCDEIENHVSNHLFPSISKETGDGEDGKDIEEW